LRELGADAKACTVTASADGRRVLVLIIRDKGGGRTLALGSGADWTAVSRSTPIDLTADGSILVAEGWESQPLRADASIELTSISRDGRTQSIAVCPHTISAVRWGSALALLDLRSEGTEQILRLRSQGACATLAEWRIPARGGWGSFRCAAGFCAIARVEGRKLSVWRLSTEAERGSELASIDVSRGTRPNLAISSDGKHVIAVSGGESVVHVISTDDSAVREIRVSDGAEPGAQHVVWSDDAHFYASGMAVTGKSYGVQRVGLDGSREVIWTSDVSWAAVTAVSPDGNTLAAHISRLETELLLVEFER
jgi:hypothetical protein